MDDVLEVVIVLVVLRDVQDGSDRLPQLHRKLLHCGAQHGHSSLCSFCRDLQTAWPCYYPLIDADFDMCFVAVVNPNDGEVPVRLPGVEVQLEVVIAELEAGQGEHHGLYDSVSPGPQQVVPAVLL